MTVAPEGLDSLGKTKDPTEAAATPDGKDASPAAAGEERETQDVSSSGAAAAPKPEAPPEPEVVDVSHNTHTRKPPICHALFFVRSVGACMFSLFFSFPRGGRGTAVRCRERVAWKDACIWGGARTAVVIAPAAYHILYM